MFSRVLSVAILGIDACQVEVEGDIALGLPAFSNGWVAGRSGQREQRPREGGDKKCRIRICGTEDSR